MNDLDFIPTWYARAQQRRRWVIGHAWALVVLVIALAAASLLVRTDVAAAAVDLSDLEAQLSQTRSDLSRYAQLQAERKELAMRRSTLEVIGLPVDPTRLLSTIEACMPQGMNLLSFELTADQTVRQVKDEKSAKLPVIQNRIRVVLRGVGSDGNQVANFFDALSHVDVFDQVRMDASQVRRERGLVMREFQIEFSIEASPQSTSEVR